MIEIGEHHARDGFFFKRQPDGSVRIRVASGSGIGAITLRTLTLPETEWASIVAHVSAHGDTGEAWQQAREFHNG